MDTNIQLLSPNDQDQFILFGSNSGNRTYIQVDLNATAISAITSTGYLKICIMEYLYDYPDTAPTVSGTNMRAYANFGTVPYLSFTATPLGYGNDVIGVSSSNIDEVISVATANIDEIIGV